MHSKGDFRVNFVTGAQAAVLQTRAMLNASSARLTRTTAEKRLHLHVAQLQRARKRAPEQTFRYFSLGVDWGVDCGTYAVLISAPSIAKSWHIENAVTCFGASQADEIAEMAASHDVQIVTTDANNIGSVYHGQLARATSVRCVPAFFDTADQNRKESSFEDLLIRPMHGRVTVSKPQATRRIFFSFLDQVVTIDPRIQGPTWADFVRHHTKVQLGKNETSGRWKHYPCKKDDHFFDAHILALAGLEILKNIQIFDNLGEHLGL